MQEEKIHTSNGSGISEEQVSTPINSAVNAQTELETAQAKAAENWDLFVRAKADLDNAQRRARLDVENAHKYGMERLAKELLSVLDTFEMGIQAANTNAEGNPEAQAAVKAIKEGMELTYKLLLDTLDKFGIKQLNPNHGDLFNPNFHEALSAQEVPNVLENSILAVAQKGYLLQERLLRPARVIIARTSINSQVDEQA
ncbi:MAG: nucleotide exchange factor GrpE [Gammaproteobacteria bacterium]